MSVGNDALVLRWLERFVAEVAQGELQRRLLDGLRRHVAECRTEAATSGVALSAEEWDALRAVDWSQSDEASVARTRKYGG